jgi:4-oxalocrotonate tautomerase
MAASRTSSRARRPVVPIAIINIIECRNSDQKRKLIAGVTQAIADSLEAPLDSVRVLVQEYPAELWGAGSQTIAERRAAAASSGKN